MYRAAWTRRAAARCALTLALVAACVALAVPLGAQAKPGPRPTLSQQCREAPLIALLQIDAVFDTQSLESARPRPVRYVPVGLHAVAERLRGDLELAELMTHSCAPPKDWAVDDWLIVLGKAQGTRVVLGPFGARFPADIDEARQAWALVQRGVELAAGGDSAPEVSAAAWVAWIDTLLALPCLREDGLHEIRSVLARSVGALAIPRSALVPLKPTLRALLDDAASLADSRQAERVARIGHELGWDVSVWVLDELERWCAAIPATPRDGGFVELLDPSTLTARQRELKVRLRARCERGDWEAARQAAVQLLDSLGRRRVTDPAQEETSVSGEAAIPQRAADELADRDP